MNQKPARQARSTLFNPTTSSTTTTTGPSLSLCSNFIWTTLQTYSHIIIFLSPPQKMEKTFLLSFLFLLFHLVPAKADLGVGIGIGIGIGIGNGGRGGGGAHNSPGPSGSSVSKMDIAYKSLQAWKSAITDDPLKILDTWTGSNVCSYTGVFCSNSFVAGIDLNHANLQGTLVKDLSLLTDLSLLHLNSNRFTGTIPETFKDLSSLEELDLSNNQFSGEFPTVVLNIPNLIYLDLRFNSFSGTLPDGLFSKNLDAILLNNNQFQGQIPQNLASSSASVINLANNKFTGTMPISSLGLVGTYNSKLKEILFLNNQLTGCIPQGVGLFRDVQVLDVSLNSLVGHLPGTLSCLEDIEVLNLAHNQLSGELSDVVCSLKSLVNLTVAYNFFNGLSQECSRLLIRNVGFDFSDNCIPGRDMQRPKPECSVIPGGSLSCLRIPIPKPLDCASLAIASSSP